MAEMKNADWKVIEIYRNMLPKKIFDAHMHIYGEGTVPNLYGKNHYTTPTMATEDYIDFLAPYFPGVEKIRLNTMPMPDAALQNDPEPMRKKMMDHVYLDLKSHPDNVGSGFILPTDTEENIEAMANGDRIRALKCYCYAVKTSDHNALEIGDYLPEAAFPVLERHKIPVIIHMMRNALEDEKNFNYITTMAKKYPDAKILLAHCARSFASYTGVKNLNKLSSFDNIWTDISAINEPAAIMASIKFDKKRTVFGTDFPVCLYRGRAFSFADNFMWLIGDAVPNGYEGARMIAEELLAIYQSALLLDLDGTDIENLFYNNALELFGVE